jgi:hypothetical protein
MIHCSWHSSCKTGELLLHSSCVLGLHLTSLNVMPMH